MTTFAADLYLLVAAYGLAISVSYAGLPMFGQSAFVAVGAFGTTQLSAHGTPLGIAVLTSVVLAAVAGYLVGFAARRLVGAALALATWGLAWLAYTALTVFPKLSGGSQGLTRATPARLASPALGVSVTLQPWAHALIAGAICVVVAWALARTSARAWGLDLAALRSGPVLADSIGVPVQRRRRAVLACTAALGALGGAGTALLLGVVAPVDYSPLLALQLFVAVLVGGTANWWGPPVGVALLAALPDTADAVARAAGIDPLRARGLLTALLFVVVLVARNPVHRWAAAHLPRRTPAPLPAAADISPAGTDTLVLAGVRANYGAVVALDGVDLELRPGEVHALVGPNGSGKSTALRVAAGVVPAQQGATRVGATTLGYDGHASSRVRAGIVRTLQRTATLGRLDARTEVAIGARAREAEPFLGLRELLGTPSSRLATARRAAVVRAALDTVGLTDRADVRSGELDSAEQRLLQIARATATGADWLLLDEPAAGMSAGQRRRLVDVVRRIAGSGCGVLLVEHDMALVGKVAERVTVLAEGRVLAHGTVAEIRRDPAVARAYLGEHAP